MEHTHIFPKAIQLNRFYIWIMVVTILASCSVSKYIPDDRAIYTGSTINVHAEGKIEDKSELVAELQELLRPKPNTKMVGWRLPLLVHYKAKFGKIGFINRFLNKKIGEPPVYMDDIDLSKSKNLLLNHLENNGYFKSEIHSTSQIKRKHGTIYYEITLDSPYVLKQYVLDTSELPIYKDIKIALEDTVLKPEQRFVLSQLKAERTRIDNYLKSLGYYNFNADYLIFEADTNLLDSKQFNLYLKLKEGVPQKALIPYTIQSIKVYPNYALGQNEANQDSVRINGVDFIQEGEFFKPHLLTAYVLLKKDERYDPKASKLTSQQFSTLGTYRFVNIRHDEIIEPDSALKDEGHLATSIYLSPLNKRSLKAEMQGVIKSNNFAGPALMLTYSNRNLFKGGELLQINGKVGYESQLTKDKIDNLNSTQFGLNADLIIPRLVPFRPMAQYKYDVPKTKISLGFEYFNRSQLYLLRTINSSYGYTWNASRYISHELNPISLNLVDLTNTTPRFDEILANNAFLANSFEQRFIGGMTYNFIFNQMTNSQIRHPFFINLNADIAGNGLSLISNGDNEGKATFLGLEYAQYAKSSVDLRYQLPLGGSHRLVTRLFAGLGIAYGNSEVMPFSRQFFAGGPYSVRAFRIRALGPGRYSPDGDNVGSFFDQAGDIRLEANTEYRFPIFSILKGAVFVDAGNVWLRKENASLPGGQFSKDFIRQLGIGAGFGLRIDVQNFVIRGDLAAPLSKPYLPLGERFDFDYQNPIFNFAIGYPF